MRELVGLAERSGEFAKLGTQVFALCVEKREELRELQEDLGGGVILLADPRGEAVDSMGMVDPAPFPDRLMARAGTFLIDRRGRVRRRWLPPSYRLRPDPAEILAAIKALD